MINQSINYGFFPIDTWLKIAESSKPVVDHTGALDPQALRDVLKFIDDHSTEGTVLNFEMDSDNATYFDLQAFRLYTPEELEQNKARDEAAQRASKASLEANERKQLAALLAKYGQP